MSTRPMAERPVLARLDAFLFVFAAVASVWLAYLLLLASFRPNWQVLLLILFWLMVAYLVLPRLHRVLTRIYLPDYFIGRARTSDGLLGDPVNLALHGEEAQVRHAMTAAGWTRADDVSLTSSMKIIRTTLTRRRYPKAPVSPLLLWGRKQDFAFQQEVEGNPSQRHHVRFWRCPDGWRLPGGYAVDWLAAGTYDRSVGLSLMTLQVTHHIAEDIDVERDHVVGSVRTACPLVSEERIRHFATGYHARNGGGDAMRTDGDLPVLDLRALPAPLPGDECLETKLTAPATRRPAPTVFGAGVTFVRAVFALVVGLLTLADPTTIEALGANPSGSQGLAAAFGILAAAALDLGLGAATYLGRNWARVTLMLFSALSIVSAFILDVSGGPRPTLSSHLPVVGLGILVLLALSSQAARDYAVASGRRPLTSPAHLDF